MKSDDEYRKIIAHFGGNDNFRKIFKGAEDFDIHVAKIFKYILKEESYIKIDANKSFKETKGKNKMSRSTFQRRNRFSDSLELRNLSGVRNHHDK